MYSVSWIYTYGKLMIGCGPGIPGWSAGGGGNPSHRRWYTIYDTLLRENRARHFFQTPHPPRPLRIRIAVELRTDNQYTIRGMVHTLSGYPHIPYGVWHIPYGVGVFIKGCGSSPARLHIRFRRILDPFYAYYHLFCIAMFIYFLR